MKNYLAGLALLLLCLAGAAAAAANARSGYPPPLHYESVSDTDTVALEIFAVCPTVLDSNSYALTHTYPLPGCENCEFLNSDTLIADSLELGLSQAEIDSLNEYTIFSLTVMLHDYNYGSAHPDSSLEVIGYEAYRVENSNKIIVNALTEKVPYVSGQMPSISTGGTIAIRSKGIKEIDIIRTIINTAIDE